MGLKRMRKVLKKAAKKVFFLPPIPTLLISVPSYVLVVYALAGKNVEPAIAYAAYFSSAYALAITVTGITGAMGFVRQGIDKHPLVRKMLGIPFVSKYLKEAMFQTEASLYRGFVINLLYAGIKLFSGILYSSIWFVTLAVYYISCWPPCVPRSSIM